jgi:hypothetical protein
VVIARQRHGKHGFTAGDTDAIVEDVVFSVWPLLGKGAVNTFPQQ